MRSCTLFLAVALVLGAIESASAETFLLKSGARIYGVEEKHPRGEPSDKWMTVRTSYGRVSFKKADLKRKLTKGHERTTLYIEEALILSVVGSAFKSDDGGKSWTRIPWEVRRSETVALGEFPQRIRAGDQVKTDSASAITLDVGWGVVRLASESVLELQMHKGATLRLTRGKIGARLEDLPKGRRFRVETPEASMGVEGTVFIVERSQNTRLAVLSGKVRVENTVVGSQEAVTISPNGEVTVQAVTGEDAAIGRVLTRSAPRPVIDWVRIPGGNFKMGRSPSPPPAWKKSEPVHEVHMQDYLLGRYEVTEGKYRQFLYWLSIHGDTNLWPDGRPGPDLLDYRCNADLGVPTTLPWLSLREVVSWSHPDLCVYRVDWRAAKAFCRWMGGRLPTEAEWEYAARAEVEGGPRWPNNLKGTRQDYAWSLLNNGRRPYSGPRMTTSGEWGDLSKKLGVRPRRVGLKLPNPFGVHDLVGNTAEWVEDTASEDYVGAPTDGAAWIIPGVNHRILRGGAWWCYPGETQGTPWSRYGGPVVPQADNLTGFRLARDLPR